MLRLDYLKSCGWRISGKTRTLLTLTVEVRKAARPGGKPCFPKGLDGRLATNCDIGDVTVSIAV